MRKEKNRLTRPVCALLAATSLASTIAPSITAYADEYNGGTQVTNTVTPPGWDEDEVTQVVNNTPTTEKLYRYETQDGHKGFAYGLKAKTSKSDNRYTTFAYTITYKGTSVVVVPSALSSGKANGKVQENYNYVSTDAIAEALVAQGKCNSLAEAAKLADEMTSQGGGSVVADSLYAFTTNANSANKSYADGNITVDKNGVAFYKGVAIKDIVSGHDIGKMAELLKTIVSGEDAAALAKKLGFSQSVINDILRNKHREIGELGLPGSKAGSDISTPIKVQGPTPMVTYHTWDNTEKDRNSATAYYVTYNDSRSFDDAIGHHDAFTEEDGKGLIIPSSESFINGVENDAYWGSITFDIDSKMKTYSATYDYSYDLVKWNPHHNEDAQDEDDYWEENPLEEGETYEDRIEEIEDDDDMEFGTRTDPETGEEISIIISYSGGWDHLGTIEKSVTVNTDRKAYTYLFNSSEADLYTFESSTSYNDAFGSDSLDYNKDEAHLINESVGPDNNGPVMGGLSTTTQTPSYIASRGSIEWQEVGPTSEQKKNAVGHLSGPNDGGFTEDPYEIAQEKAQNHLEKVVGDGKSGDSQLTNGSTVKSFAKAVTGEFRINYGGSEKVFMESSENWVRFDNGSYTHKSDFSISEAAVIPYLSSHYPKNAFLPGIGGVDVNTFETSPAFNKTMTRVPDDQSNGEYPTEVEAKYTAAVTTAGESLAGGTTNFDRTGNIKDEYYCNEPVIVQTPVISPVEIYRDNGEDLDSTDPRVSSSETDPVYTGGTVNKSIPTQLVKGKADGSIPQLRLDETYWFRFSVRAHLEHMGYRDADTHSNAWDNLGDTDSKYDKYVKAKYVHFPVDVILYQNGSPRYIKHTSNESDAEYWVKLDKKDWEYVKFYIPVWAKEGIHSAGEDQLKYKVESINVISKDDEGQGAGDHSNDENAMAEELNDEGDIEEPDKELYIATYDIPIQISGWIYDFQVVGINDADTFDVSYDEDSAFNSNWYALAANGEEKKAGTLNRLGGDSRYVDIAPYVRRTVDGKVINPWNKKNTITMGRGSSHKYDQMGEQRKGTQFAFSLRTISNLWHDNDKISITPTFKYYDAKKDKTYSQKDEEIYIYYHDQSGEYKQLYVPYGSTKDKSLVRNVQLGRKEFRGSYYDRDLEQTAKAPLASYNGTGDVISFTNTKSGSADDQNEFLQRKTDAYNLSQIVLPSSLRMYSGDLEQLRENLVLC